jgi:hypothetical protein
VVSLLEEIRNILLNPASKPKIVIIVLFCLRIVILKASPQVCANVLKFIWPIAFVHVIMALNNQLPAEDFNVKLAALKLLEVVNLKCPELFNLNYWIIGADGVGVEYKQMKEESKVADAVHSFASPFRFVPFLSKLVNRQIEIKYRTVENEAAQPDRPPLERDWVITESRVDTDEDLSHVALRMLKEMARRTGRVLTPIRNVDDIVIEDFKRLNDFGVQ